MNTSALTTGSHNLFTGSPVPAVLSGRSTSIKKLQKHQTSRLKLNSNGDLIVSAKNGQIVFNKPIVYQEDAGRRRPVQGWFTLLAKNTIRFSLGNYDRTRALVIDPTLAYSTYLEGTGSPAEIGGQGATIAVDGAGNAYIAGFTSVLDFPVTSGALQTSLGGSQITRNSTYAFVTKLDPTGSKLIYSTHLSGSGNLDNYGDSISSIFVDTAGDAYVAGRAFSPISPRQATPIDSQ